MEGQIDLESEFGVGSTFRFTGLFGVGERASTWTTASGVLEERKCTLDTLPLDGVRVLLADPNATGRKITGDILKNFGANLKIAATLQEFATAMNDAANSGLPFDSIAVDSRMLQEPDQLLEQMESMFKSGENKVMAMLPSNIAMRYLQPQQWIQNAMPIKKPVGMFKLLGGINWILGRGDDPSKMDNLSVIRKAPVSLRILLVEDLYNNQKLAIDVLAKVGHMISIANHGVEALEILKDQTFDLILMDLQMPEMGGMETTEEIRKGDKIDPANRHIPIIAVTARSSPEEKNICLEGGMNGYLRKPYHPHELMEIVAPYSVKRKKPGQRKKRKTPSQVLVKVEHDQATLNTMRQTFLDNREEWFDQLERAIMIRDVNRAAKTVGQIKQAATDIGARQVAIRTMRFKGRVEMESWSEAKEALEELVGKYNTAVEELIAMESDS